MFHRYWYSHSNSINEYSNSSQEYIHIRIGEKSFPKLLKSSLDSIYIQYETKIRFALSTMSSIPIPIK